MKAKTGKVYLWNLRMIATPIHQSMNRLIHTNIMNSKVILSIYNGESAAPMKFDKS